MHKEYRVGVLGTLNAPLLGHIIRAVLGTSAKLNAVICDSKLNLQRDLTIWEDRVGDRIIPFSLDQFTDSKVPFYFVENANSDKTLQLIKELGLDLLVNGGVPRILKPAVLNSVPKGVLNVHPGLIPEYRGCCCIEWAIHNNDPVGNTVHLMSEQIDLGVVLTRRVVDVSDAGTFQDVCSMVYLDGVGLLSETLARLLDGSVTTGKPLSPDDGSYYKPITDEILLRIKDTVRRGQYLPAWTADISNIWS